MFQTFTTSLFLIKHILSFNIHHMDLERKIPKFAFILWYPFTWNQDNWPLKKKRYKHNNWHQTLEAGKIFHSLGCEYHSIDITAGLLLLSVSSVCSCHREKLSPGAVHQVLTLSAIHNWFRPEQALQMIQ